MEQEASPYTMNCPLLEKFLAELISILKSLLNHIALPKAWMGTFWT